MLNLEERELSEGGRREIRVRGELDLAVAPRLQEALDRSVGSERLILSLHDCEFIDSTGIAVIVRDYMRREKEGGKIAIAGCSDQVQRIFEVTGLTENLVFDSLDEALAAVE